MIKCVVSMTIESKILEDFKKTVGYGNVSKEIEKFMRESIGQNPEQLDKAILKKKIERLNNQITPLITKRDTLNKQMSILIEEDEEKELKVLEDKREIEEKAQKCYGCGKTLTKMDKPITRKNHTYHNYFCYEKTKDLIEEEKEKN